MSKLDTWMRLTSAVCLSFCLSCITDSNTPDVSGPSVLGISLEMSAIPDKLVADGWSSSVIEVVYRDENGQRRSGQTVKFDLGARSEIVTGGAFSDIGNLAPLNGPRPVAGGTESHAVSDVTDSDGVARARYWAPFRTDQVNDIAVTVTARPAGDDFRGETLRQVDIQLTAADRPLFPGTAACGISVEPLKTEYGLDEEIFFTATQATGSGGGGSGCGGNPIARYEWDFGDGKTAVGRTVSHIFSGGCESGCTVTLWTTESQTGCVETCTVTITTEGSGSGSGPGPGPGPGPPGETLFSFPSSDVPQGANSGAGCPNGIPCIISTVDTSGVTGTIVHMRVGFHGNFPDASDTWVHLYGPGYPGVDERASFDNGNAVGAGWGSSCNINPRGTFTGPGATTWDDEAPGTVAGGTTPYDASYRGSLSPGLNYIKNQLNANPGDINGTFTLVIDRWTAGGITTETLTCWTLEIWTVP